MEKWILVIVFATVFVIGMSESNRSIVYDDPGQVDLDLVDGEEAYVNNCSACHGGDLTGTAGPDITEVGNYYSVEEIEDIIENGLGSMPGLPHVSDDERVAIAKWLVDQSY